MQIFKNNMFRKCLSSLLAFSLIFSAMPITVFAEGETTVSFEDRVETSALEIEDNDGESEVDSAEFVVIQPDLTVEYQDEFTKGAPFEFIVLSDMSGLITVSLLYENESLVHLAAEEIIEGTEFVVDIGSMPNAEAVDFVVTVRPENAVVDLKGTVAVPTMETISVYSSDDSVEEVNETDEPEENMIDGDEVIEIEPEPEPLINDTIPSFWGDEWRITHLGGYPNHAVIELDPSWITGAPAALAFDATLPSDHRADPLDPFIVRSLNEADNALTGNFAGQQDRAAFISQQLPYDADFRISGWMTLDQMATDTNAQQAAGFIVRNNITDLGHNNVPTPLVFAGVAASPENTITTENGAGILRHRVGGSGMEVNSFGPRIDTPELGEAVYVELVRIGDQFTSIVDGKTSTISNNSFNEFAVTDDIDATFGLGVPNRHDPYIYVGMATNRNFQASYRHVDLEVLDPEFSIERLELADPDLTLVVAEGEVLEIDQIEIRMIQSDGNVSYRPVSELATLVNPDTSTKGNQYFTIGYLNATLDIPFLVADNPVVDIDVVVPPSKVFYRVGEPFDPSGLQVRMHFEYGEPRYFDYTDIGTVIDVTGFDTNVFGDVVMTVTPYNETMPADTFTIVRQDVYLDSLSLTPPTRTVYFAGEEVPRLAELLRGSTVTAIWSDGTEEILAPGEFDTNFGSGFNNDLTEWGMGPVVPLQISVGTVVAYFEFEISEIMPVDLAVVTYADRTTFAFGEEIDFTGLEIGIRYNNGTLGAPGLLGVDFELDDSNVDHTEVGLYQVEINGLSDEFAGLFGEFNVSVMEAKDMNPREGWEYRRFGESAQPSQRRNTLLFLDRDDFTTVLEDPLDESGGILPETKIGEMHADIAIELESTRNAGKLTNSGQDGINYYYYRMPYYQNFRLEATVDLISIGQAHLNWASTQQMSFGIMMRDQIAPEGDLDTLYSNILMVGNNGVTPGHDGVSNRVAPRWRDYEGTWRGGVDIPVPGAEDVSNTRYFNFDLNPWPVPGWEEAMPVFPEPRWNPNFPEANEVNNTMHIVFEHNNNNFSGVMTVNGVTESWSFDHGIDFTIADQEDIYIGFFTARDAHARFYDVDLTITDGRANDPGPEPEFPPVTPDVNVISSPTVSYLDDSAPYELQIATNATGYVTVLHDGHPVVSNMYIDEAGVMTSIPEVTVTRGTPDVFRIEFLPDSDGNYTAFDRVILSHSVTFENYESGNLYVAPDGILGAIGSEENPTTLPDAINRIAPGNTIIMLPGTYTTPINIGWHNNGNADARKEIFARPGAIIDTPTSVSNIYGNYWHLRGMTINGRVNVGGHHSIFELMTIRNSNETGFQISRQDSLNNPAGNALGDINTWPGGHLVLNVESYGHQDVGSTNADGFGVKLSSGYGNHFIGAIAHHNVDDGFDLFTKGVPIGAVIIDWSIAYRNGRLMHESDHVGADGQGFKLGGEGVWVQHVVRNSIAFENKGSGFTSNSNPGVTLIDNVSFDNFGGNLNLTGRGTDLRNHIIVNFVSYRRFVQGSEDNAQRVINGALVSGQQSTREVWETNDTNIETALNRWGTVESDLWNDIHGNFINVPHSIYVGPSAPTGKFANDIGRPVTDEFFYLLDAPGWTTPEGIILTQQTRTNHLHAYHYALDHNITDGSPAIIFGDFLRLTDFAFYHDRQHTVKFQTFGGSDVASQTVFYRQLISEPADPTGDTDFLGWYEDRLFTTPWEWDFDHDVLEEDITIYAKWESGEIDRGPLAILIDTAQSLYDETVVSLDGTDVSVENYWAPESTLDDLSDSILLAQNAYNDPDSDQATIDSNAQLLSNKINAFKQIRKLGTYVEASTETLILTPDTVTLTEREGEAASAVIELGGTATGEVTVDRTSITNLNRGSGELPEWIEVSVDSDANELVVTVGKEAPDMAINDSWVIVIDRQGASANLTIEVDIPAENVQVICDDDEGCLENNPVTPVPPTRPSGGPRLPQTGATVGSLSLIGLIILGSGVSISKLKKKSKQ